jgi:Dihydrofolate reductase
MTNFRRSFFKVDRFVIEHSSVVVCSSLDDAMTYITKSLESFAHVMVIGGSQIYEEAVRHPLCRYVFLTRIFGTFASDVFFPVLDPTLFQRVCNLSLPVLRHLSTLPFTGKTTQGVIDENLSRLSLDKSDHLLDDFVITDHGHTYAFYLYEKIK